MEVTKEKIRYILQFFLDKGENASQAAEIVNGVYGVHNYASRTGRPVVENVDKIKEIIEVDQYVSSRSITQELNIDHKTVLNPLCKVGFKKKLDVWVPHQLTPELMMDQISIYETLAKRNEIDPFLKRMVTWDKKWVTYDNIVRKRSWSKRDLYCQQLERLKLVINQKRSDWANRRGAVFHQDNARQHTSVVTRQKLWELSWEVLMHPPYSPNLAPSDYHLFLALQNFLNHIRNWDQEKIAKLDY
ncbi:histone-lysine N-methyltransferase SETMAR [Trichonephila clavipes]|nr:histone-lysine N-methyltransferase SETMAR [Trichonephila clavipes]